MEIKRVYTQTIPATRFIGIKYGDSDRVNGSFGAKWCKAFQDGLFEKIETAANAENKLSARYEDADAYVGLMRCKAGEPFEYWIGMFTPPETAVPNDLGFVDFPASTLGVGWIYGSDNTGELYCHEDAVAEKLCEAGYHVSMNDKDTCCFFERYQCPRFTTPDEKGNVILDICFFI